MVSHGSMKKLNAKVEDDSVFAFGTEWKEAEKSKVRNCFFFVLHNVYMLEAESKN